jgi:hypothetical protein
MKYILNLIYDILVHILIIFIIEVLMFYLVLKDELSDSIKCELLLNINKLDSKKKTNIKTLLDKKRIFNYIYDNGEKIIIDNNNNKIKLSIIIFLLVILLLILIVIYISRIYKIKLHIDYVQLISALSILISLELILIFQYNFKLKQNIDNISLEFFKYLLPMFEKLKR